MGTKSEYENTVGKVDAFKVEGKILQADSS